MSATPVNKEEVRAVVLELGYEQAAIKLGIKPGTLRQWARRFHWNKVRHHAQQTVTTVTNPVQVIADSLAEHEKETRLSLAKSARRMAKDAEECTLRDADKALKVGQLSAIVHKWNDGQKGESFSLNVLNMGSLEVRVGKEAQDQQSEG